MARGRKSKLTPLIQEAIIRAVAAGADKTVAAVHAGISVNTLHEWVARGEGTDPGRRQMPLYANFAKALRKAEADAELTAIAVIRKAAMDGTWQAAAWFLERKHYQRWARAERMNEAEQERQIAETVALVAEETGLTPEELRAEAEAMVRKLDARRGQRAS